jgi:hypothetical protein
MSNEFILIAWLGPNFASNWTGKFGPFSRITFPMITFSCPHCQKTFQVDHKLSGKRAKCSRCNTIISIPSTTPEVVTESERHDTDQSALPHEKNHSLKEKSSTTTLFFKGSLGRRSKFLLGLVAATILSTVVAVSWLMFSFLSGNNWEAANTPRIFSILEEANSLRQSEPLKAYRLFGDVIDELKNHTITGEKLLLAIADAEKFRTDNQQRITDLIQQEEVEKQRLANEKALDDQRLAREAIRKAEEEKEIRDREKRRKEVAARYLNAPQSARPVLNLIKKLEARTEVGINFRDYSTIVGETWAEIKVFCESPDGELVPEFSQLLLSAISKYKLALDIWTGKIDFNDKNQFDEAASEIVLQELWRAAGGRIQAAESFLREGSVDTGISMFDSFSKSDQTYDQEITEIKVQLIVINLSKKLIEFDENNNEYRVAYDEAVAKFRNKLQAIIAKESPGIR